MRPLTLLILLLAAWGQVVLAQSASSPPYQASPPPAAGTSAPPSGAITIGDVTITGSLRSRVYFWNWFQGATGENQYEYSGNLLRVSWSENLRLWDWNIELALPFLLGLPANATNPAPQGALGLGSNYYTADQSSRNNALIFPKQIYMRFHPFSEAQTLQVGRFTFADGGETAPRNATLATLKRDRISQRLIGDFGWSDVGRSFDGIHYADTLGSGDFTVVAATPTRGVFQTDGWGWNRTGFAYGGYTRDWGRGRHAADTRFFVLEYDDWRHILKTDNRPTAVRKGDTGNIVITTFGGHSVQTVSTQPGTIDLLAWGAVQTGRWGQLEQRAYALDFEGGLQPAILPKLKPWLRGGLTMGSGDDKPNDNRHGTFFQVLPTPRPYARFPFFNMMNTEDRIVSLIQRPQAKVTISSEFHSLRLSNANDLWYSGGGVFQPWTFGYTGRNTSGRRSLGNLYDTSVEYRQSRKLTLTAYLGYTQGLASIKAIYPQGRNGQFGYLEGMYRF
jgi:hypothetical protein